MLLQENFTATHIQELRERSNRDPILLERTVYAFGLLEALARVGLPFIFKGVTRTRRMARRYYLHKSNTANERAAD